MEHLPIPGELLIYDYSSSVKHAPGQPLNVLQWNVERNYKSDEIIETLKRLDPDIAIIQEIDINCKRSGNVNHMESICKALGWKGGFVAEFFEVESPIRQPRDQGGGVHGNAIFSKYSLDFRVIHHKHHPFEWERDGERLREPRVGRRYSLAAQVIQEGLPPMLCYCIHLEVFCGIIGRISAFSDILQDSRAHLGTNPHQLIFGDLNTMAHSIARLSPKYATDRYRFLSLGKSESQWWMDNVFGWRDSDGPLNMKLYFAGYNWLYAFYTWFNKLVYGKVHHPTWPSIGGFSTEVLQAARNPGFVDCWPYNITTLTNYRGLFKARLDWTLTRQFEVLNKEIGNTNYSASDHAYLMVKVAPTDQA